MSKLPTVFLLLVLGIVGKHCDGFFVHNTGVQSQHRNTNQRCGARESRTLNMQLGDRKEFMQKTVAGLSFMGFWSNIFGAPSVSSAEDSVSYVSFDVQLDSKKTGEIVIEVHPEWAPIGAERFTYLTKKGLFDGCRFFRVIPGFVAQFGINGDPKTAAIWKGNAIADDPVTQTNARGTVVFATAGPNSRTTQLFINFNDNTFLDRSGFSPIGKVVKGMDVVDALYSGYGEGAPRGKGPNQIKVQLQGNAYLEKEFPLLSYINKAKITEQP